MTSYPETNPTDGLHGSEYRPHSPGRAAPAGPGRQPAPRQDTDLPGAGHDSVPPPRSDRVEPFSGFRRSV